MASVQELEARVRALEEAFRAQSLALNVILRGHADAIAESLGDTINDLLPEERAGHYGQALLDLRYHLQALAEIDQDDAAS